jgi:hypothetical protein
VRTPCNSIGTQSTGTEQPKQFSLRMPKETWLRLMRLAAGRREAINSVVLGWIEEGLRRDWSESANKSARESLSERIAATTNPATSRQPSTSSNNRSGHGCRP